MGLGDLRRSVKGLRLTMKKGQYVKLVHPSGDEINIYLFNRKGGGGLQLAFEGGDAFRILRQQLVEELQDEPHDGE